MQTKARSHQVASAGVAEILAAVSAYGKLGDLRIGCRVSVQRLRDTDILSAAAIEFIRVQSRSYGLEYNAGIGYRLHLVWSRTELDLVSNLLLFPALKSFPNRKRLTNAIQKVELSRFKDTNSRLAVVLNHCVFPMFYLRFVASP